MNIVSYIRVSGRGQLDGDGPERQRDSIIQFDKTNNLVWHKEFFEKGVSGTVDGMDRPEFAAMLDYIMGSLVVSGTPPIAGIVVERLDRLARDLMVSEMLLKECRDRGIKVFSADIGLVDQATNDGDPSRKLIRQVIGAVAEFAKSELVMKLSKARTRIRKQTGRCEGRKPYGARPGEQTILSAIRGYASINLSLEKIAGILNDSGFKTRYGKPWTRQNVGSIIASSNKVTKG